MTKKASLYIGLTIASGAGLAAYCLAAVAGKPHSEGYFIYCLLAWLSSALKVRLPGLTGTMSVNFIFILIALATLSFAETVLLASVASLVQSLWRARIGRKPIKAVFNLAALALSSGAAYRISHLLAGDTPSHLAVLLTIAASFYLTANTLLISGVVSLVERQSVAAVWKQCYLWSFPYYLAGAFLATMAVEVYRSSGLLTSLLIVFPMCLIYLFYKAFLERVTAPTVPVSN